MPQQQRLSAGEEEPVAFVVVPPHSYDFTDKHFPSTGRVRDASTSPLRPHEAIDLHKCLHKVQGFDNSPPP